MIEYSIPFHTSSKNICFDWIAEKIPDLKLENGCPFTIMLCVENSVGNDKIFAYSLQ